jgi:branched-chain amino acid transport system substrate-binding protein
MAMRNGISRRSALTLIAGLPLLGAAAAPAQGGKPIRIGFIHAMTGEWSTTSLYIKNGIYMARDEWNAKGGINGRPILLIEEDDASKTAEAVTAYNKVIDKDICAMFGQTYSTQVLAEAPFIIKTGVPYVFSATNPKITQMGNKWMFRLRTNDEVVGQILAHYVVDKLKLKKVALTYGNEEYGRTGAKVVEDTLKSLGVTPVAITTHTPNDKDFTAQMLNMKKAEAQCIISYCFVQEHGLMIKQKHELAMDDVVYFGSPTMTTPITMKLAGEAADYNVYGVADWVRTDPRPDSLAWVKKYEPKFKIDANNYSAVYYDGANMLFSAIAKVGTDPEAIRKEMLQIKGYKGIAYTYTFPPNGDGPHASTVVKFEKGDFKIIEAAFEKGFGPDGPLK